MRNVDRPAQPDSLRRNAANWKRELVKQVGRFRGDSSRVPESFFKHYKKDDVLQTLKSMYNSCCCYCEGFISDVSFDRIEHLKPKRKFPRYTFDWNNLHLICEKCNIFKSDQYDAKNPILDPVIDKPISQHLTYHFYMVKPLSRRGKTTVSHPRLNRPELKTARGKIFWETLRIIEAINVNPDDPANDEFINDLDEKSDGEYGSLMAYVKQTFLKI